MITVKNVVDGVFDVAKAINPMTTKWSDKQEEIAMVLLDKGYTPKEIVDFVGVDIDDLEAFLSFEMALRNRLSQREKKTA